MTKLANHKKPVAGLDIEKPAIPVKNWSPRNTTSIPAYYNGLIGAFMFIYYCG
jgi:hypothetical protein